MAFGLRIRHQTCLDAHAHVFITITKITITKEQRTMSSDSIAPDATEANALVTAVDRAWAAARQAETDASDPNSVDDLIAAQFIDTVLNEPLICPVWSNEEADAEPTANDDDISPKMIDLNGADTLLLFDSEERLSAYVGEPTDFIALPGRAFFDIARGQNAQIALNLDVAPSSTVFNPSTVDAIADVADTTEQIYEVQGDQPLEVGPPDGASETLLSAVTARIAAAASLTCEAWLFSVSYPAENKETHRNLVLGMVARNGADPDDLRRLAAELGRLGGVLLEDTALLDIAYFAPGERLYDLARRHGVGVLMEDGSATRPPGDHDVSAA